MKTYKSNKPVELVLVSDIHIGAETHNEKFFDFLIKYIKDGKRRKFAYLGDAIENNLRDSPGNVLFDKLSPEDQADLWVKKMKPIKRKCLVYNGISNHSERTTKIAGFPIERFMAVRLDQPITKPIDFLDLTIGDKTYTIAHQHGTSGGTTTAGRIRAQDRFALANDADIFIQGHLHMAEVSWTYKRTKRGTYKPNLKVTNGSCLDYQTSYGDKKNYMPSPAHFVTILFNKDNDIQTKTIIDKKSIEW